MREDNGQLQEDSLRQKEMPVKCAHSSKDTAFSNGTLVRRGFSVQPHSDNNACSSRHPLAHTPSRNANKSSVSHLTAHWLTQLLSGTLLSLVCQKLPMWS